MHSTNSNINKYEAQSVHIKPTDLINNKTQQVFKCSRFVHSETNTLLLSSNSHQRDIAAIKIQKIYRKYVAAKSYKYMFEGGTDFKQYKELIPTPSKTLDYLDKLQLLSTRFINEIKEELGKFTENEKKFINKISSLNNLTFKHQTIYKLHHLDNQKINKLTLASSLYLDQHNITAKRHTVDEDITRLKNQDFVFFSIDFSGRDISYKPSSSYLGPVDYGYRSYTIKKQPEQDFSYFTLSDHLTNCIEITESEVSNNLYSQFPIVLHKVRRLIYCKLGKKNAPIFTKQDILYALAYHSILFVRKCKNKDFNNYIYSNLSLKNIDILLNSIFNPEAHIPRLVTTYEFAEHILREPSLDEIYYIGDINQIINYCLSPYDKKITSTNSLKDILLNIAHNFNQIISKSSKDNNAEIIRIILPHMEKLSELKETHDFFSSHSILDYKIQIAIIENDVTTALVYLKQLQLNSQGHLSSIIIEKLLGLDDYLTYANLLLQLFTENNDQQSNFSPLGYGEKDLYILTDKFQEIALADDIDISNYLADIYGRRIDSSKYIKHQNKYVNYIAYLLIKYKPELTYFTEIMLFFVNEELNQNISYIEEDIIFIMLSNNYLTKQSYDILKKSFIENGILVPDKKIKAYFYINHNSTLDYTDANSFIKKEDSLKNYAANRYNIYL